MEMTCLTISQWASWPFITVSLLRADTISQGIGSDSCVVLQKTADTDWLEHFSAKWIRFAIKNAAKQRRELIPRKWKRL